MKKGRRIPAMASTAILFAAGFWLLITQAATAAAAGWSVLDHAVEHASPAQSHLYVLDLSNKAVYRFPLAQDGLPATQPDGVLYPEGAVSPTGVAVDNVGHVFVADANPGIVSEFAAGATGPQQPISILNVSGPDYLKLDDAERLYVHQNRSQDIAIFAKGAHGNDSPISVVPPYYKLEWATDYVIANFGALYVLDQGGSVAVYNDPLQSPSQPNRFIRPDGGGAFDFTLALDVLTDRLYIQFYVSDPQYWNKVNYDVRPASVTSVPAAHVPWIYTGDCGPKGNAAVFGTVVVKKYLIVSCNSFSEVLVYRKDIFGRQRAPVEIVGQGSLLSPMEMAVGP